VCAVCAVLSVNDTEAVPGVNAVCGLFLVEMAPSLVTPTASCAAAPGLSILPDWWLRASDAGCCPPFC
jgi:hypothetical protein